MKIILLSAALLILFAPIEVKSATYKFIDDRGTTHFVDTMGRVPVKYRDQLQLPKVNKKIIREKLDDYLTLNVGYGSELIDENGRMQILVGEKEKIKGDEYYRVDRISENLGIYRSEYLKMKSDGLYSAGRKMSGKTLIFREPIMILKREFTMGDSWTVTLKADDLSDIMQIQIKKIEKIFTPKGKLDALKIVITEKGSKTIQWYSKGLGLIKEDIYKIGKSLTSLASMKSYSRTLTPESLHVGFDAMQRRLTIEDKEMAAKQTHKKSPDMPENAVFYGTWRSSKADKPIKLLPDGRWEVSALLGTSKVAGSWRVKGDSIIWTYDDAPAGLKDVNKIIESEPDKFILKERDGSHTTFNREKD